MFFAVMDRYSLKPVNLIYVLNENCHNLLSSDVIPPFFGHQTIDFPWHFLFCLSKTCGSTSLKGASQERSLYLNYITCKAEDIGRYF
jgi:hypothetical protein